ncbi:helix-turn-helix domain-containing protein [Helicobacter sp. T3_23-1059]
MAHSNQNEIRLYFETHDASPKEVAQKFGISYRTLAHWIKTQNWQRACALKNISTQKVQTELLHKEFGTAMAITHNKIKQDLRDGLSGVYASELNESIKNAMLDEASEELLARAMGAKFLQQNAISAALLAKNEMLRMIANRSKESDPLILGAAKEVAKLFLEMSESLHGKGVSQILEVQTQEDLENLSADELKAFIAQNS